MTNKQYIELLQKFVNAEPVEILLKDNQIKKVDGLKFRGNKCLGFSDKESETIYPLEQIKAVFFD